MSPLLLPGDEILVEFLDSPRPPKESDVHQIYLYKEAHEWVAHRVVCEQGALALKGDNSACVDSDKHMLWGKVVGLHRNGKRLLFSEPVVEFSGLSRSFADEQILKDVNLNIHLGDRIAICGPNGCGKTTLLRIIVGLIVPSSGTGSVMGADLDNSSELNKQVAWVPAQYHGFFPRLSGWDNLRLFASLDGVAGQQFADRVAKYRDYLPLEKALRTPFYLCSTGMRKSLILARAFIKNAPVVVLDEPTNGLDKAHASSFRELLREEGREKAIIFASHLEEDLNEVASKVYLLKEGSLVASSN